MDKEIFDQADVQKNIGIVIVMIIIDVLFFLPLVVCKDSRYGKFYANQVFLLFIISLVSGFLSKIPLLGGIIGFVIGGVVLLTKIYLIIGAANGKAYKVPVIGDITLFN